MLFKKLFRLLVLGGAVVGTASGCAQTAEAQTTSPKKSAAGDAGAPADAGPNDSSGGGVPGW
jgi:hypothetical protein